MNEPTWDPIITVPRSRWVVGTDGKVVHEMYYGKTSHVPLYGWNYLRNGDPEDAQLWNPTHWRDP